MPVGMLYLAKALNEIGIFCTLLDLQKDRLEDLVLKDYLFVGISMLTGKMISRGLQVAARVRKGNAAIPIVVGGVHPTVLPEQTLANPLIDIIVMGEGERTLQELSLALLGKGYLADIKGLAYTDGGELRINPPRDFLDINSLDYRLPYELLGLDFKQLSNMSIHTSRGCPYRCGFCYSTIYCKRKYRAKNADLVVAELEYVRNKFGIRNLGFGAEDEFFIDTKRVAAICEKIIEKNLDITWSSFCRFDSLDRVDDNFLDLIKRAGCTALSFGAESGSQRMLDDVIKKDITVEQVIRGTSRLHAHGISHIASFICCFPDETKADMYKSFELIDTISKGNTHLFLNGIFMFTPIPGTPLFDHVVEQYSFKVPDTLEGWGEYEIGSLPTSMITWQPYDYVSWCRGVYLTSTLPYYSESFDRYKTFRAYVHGTMTSYAGHYPFYMMAKIVRWRWKHRFFSFSVDLILMNWVKKMLPHLHAIYSWLRKHLQ